MQDLWDAVNTQVIDFTHSVTLKSLLVEQLALGGKIEQKPSPNRGVFRKPLEPSVHPNVPNPVFALGQTSRARG